MHAMLNPIAGSDLVTTNHVEKLSAGEFLAVLLDAGIDVLEFRGVYLRLGPAAVEATTSFRCEYVVDDRSIIDDVQAGSAVDAVARVTHDAICEGSNVDTVTVNGQTYGAVPMRSLYSVGCDTEEVDEVMIWVDTPTFSNEATVSEVLLVPEQADLSARVRELEYECAQLREQLEAHRGAAENLCMPVSSDRGAVPCWSEGESGDEPHRGWHYVLGGPYTSYTLPEASEDGLLFWWRFDQDEGCWAESECLGARILSDDIHEIGTCEETEAKLQQLLEVAAPKP